MPIVNLLKEYIVVILLLFPSLCFSETDNIIYVNGIQNTFADHEETLDTIQAVLARSENHLGTMQKNFHISGIWNPIGFKGDTNGGDLSEDMKELFLLKTAEEHFANDFRLILAPHDTNSLVDQSAAARIVPFITDMTPGGNSLEEGSSPITDADMNLTRNVIIALYGRVKLLGSAVIVAHSQGNLLANLAYARLVSDFGNDIRKKVMVVNIANTAQFSASRLNLSHAGDRALYPSYVHRDLTTYPSQFINWNRTTPNCSNTACDFILTPPTLGAVDTGGWNEGTADSNLQHSITTTYLSNFVVDTILDQQGVTLSNLTQRRFVDLFEDFVYTAANAVNRGIYSNNVLKNLNVALPADNCMILGNEFDNVTDGNIDTGYPASCGGSFPIDLRSPLKIKKLLIHVKAPIEGQVTYAVFNDTTLVGKVFSGIWKNNQDIEIDLSQYNTSFSFLHFIIYNSPPLLEINEIQGFL